MNSKNPTKLIKNGTIVALVILALLSACSPNPNQTAEQQLIGIKIGYCPTMTPHVQALAKNHKNVTPILYDNSALAMDALHAGAVQAILIGRSAREHELTDGLRLLLVEDGLTLIAQHPGVIRYEDLPKIRILTHEGEAAIQDLIPVRINVVYYDDFTQMLADMDSSVAVLLRWSQVSPDNNLLIPVDVAGLKIPAFRSPHFYYLDSMEDTLLPIFNTYSTNK